MTSSRIAKVFQPVILSPVKAGGHFIVDDISSKLSQSVLTFSIDFQDGGLIDIPATSTPVQTARY